MESRMDEMGCRPLVLVCSIDGTRNCADRVSTGRQRCQIWIDTMIQRGSQSFTSPLITCLNSLRPSTEKATILASLSPAKPVSTSFVDVPSFVDTASAT